MPYDEQVMAVLEGRGLQAGVAEAGPSKLKLFLASLPSSCQTNVPQVQRDFLELLRGNYGFTLPFELAQDSCNCIALSYVAQHYVLGIDWGCPDICSGSRQASCLGVTSFLLFYSPAVQVSGGLLCGIGSGLHTSLRPSYLTYP